MFRIITVAFLALCLHVNQIKAQDFDDLFDDIEVEEITESPLTINGDFEFKYTVPYSNMENYTEPELSNLFKVSYSSENIELVSNWKLLVKQSDYTENRLVPDENYIKMLFGNTDITAGYSLYSWGHADKINPTDYLNSRDYTNPLESEKIPALGFALSHYFETASIDLVFIPFRDSDIFPVDITAQIPGVSLNQREGLKNIVIGSRLNYFGTVDLSLSYIYDIDGFYSIENQSMTSIELYNRDIHRIGLSTKTTIGAYGIWAEANYSYAEKHSPYIEWIGGIDRSFGPADEGFINIQSFGKYLTDYSDNEVQNTLQNNADRLTIGGVGKISYKLLNEEIEPEFLFIYRTFPDNTVDFIYRPKVYYRPIDSLALTAGIDIITTDDHIHDKGYFKVEYSW